VHQHVVGKNCTSCVNLKYIYTVYSDKNDSGKKENKKQQNNLEHYWLSSMLNLLV